LYTINRYDDDGTYCVIVELLVTVLF
jgi:hypothetical protein